QHGEPGPAVVGGDERLGEARVGHFAVGLPAGQERLPAVVRAVDQAGDRAEHAFGEGPGVLLQFLLAVAQGEIDGHGGHLLSRRYGTLGGWQSGRLSPNSSTSIIRSCWRRWEGCPAGRWPRRSPRRAAS